MRVRLAGTVTPDLEESVVFSAIHKYVRRGAAEKAMYWGLALVRHNPEVFWEFIMEIAVEDVGQPVEIVAVDTLRSRYALLSRRKATPPLEWEKERLAVCACRVLAFARKDRGADEFLELESLARTPGAAKTYFKGISKLDDWIYDKHTTRGRAMGRGNDYWINTSSVVSNPAPGYAEWRQKFSRIALEHYARRTPARTPS